MSEIDVSICKHYREQYIDNEGDYFYDVCLSDETLIGYCSEIKDCYYKQLQQLKQENEGLKEDNKDLKTNLLEMNKYNPRCYLVVTYREKNELHKKFIYQRVQKEQAEQKLEKIKEMVIEQKTSKFYSAILDDILELIESEEENEY